MKTFLQDNWRYVLGIIFAVGVAYTTLAVDVARLKSDNVRLEATVIANASTSSQKDEALQRQYYELMEKNMQRLGDLQIAVAGLSAKVEQLASQQHSFPKGGQ